jgi:hypothetical protein
MAAIVRVDRGMDKTTSHYGTVEIASGLEFHQTPVNIIVLVPKNVRPNPNPQIASYVEFLWNEYKNKKSMPQERSA